MDQETAMQALRGVMDPELGKNIVDLNMVRDLTIEGDKVSFDFYLTTPACPLKNTMKTDAEKALKSVGASEVNVNFKSDVKSHKSHVESKFIDPGAFEGIKNIIPVYSAKGGVGKSTVAVNLAIALQERGAKVGLLDLDVYGPTIPRMMGISEAPTQFGNKLIPIRKYDTRVMSIGLLMQEKQKPLIWRGPLASSVVKQLFEDVEWEELDYMVVDLPPGTGDIQITFAQNVPVSGTIFVTTPQSVALDDTIKGIDMFRQMNVPVLGVVKNMAYFECPKCAERTDMFPQSEIWQKMGGLDVPVLGELPIDPEVAKSGDLGEPLAKALPDSLSTKAFDGLACGVAAAVSTSALRK